MSEPTPITARPLMTTADVARQLVLSETRIKELARAGDLPAHRIGRVWRFDVADVRTYLESVRTAPAAPPAQADRTPLTLVAPLDASDSANGYVPVDFDALAREASR